MSLANISYKNMLTSIQENEKTQGFVTYRSTWQNILLRSLLLFKNKQTTAHMMRVSRDNAPENNQTRAEVHFGVDGEWNYFYR